MSKVTVYLPDDLHERVKANGIKLSPVCQQALAAACAVAESPLEGMEVVDEVYKWLLKGRRLIRGLEDFLA
jgi:hypothetical protein